MIDKKKLKEEYKNLIPDKGVFTITNTKTGRIFLGSGLNLRGMLDKHRFMLDLGSHKNKQLQTDWQALGEKAFMFEVIETLELKKDPRYNYDEDLNILEYIWIEKYRPFAAKCYNEDDRIRMV